MLRFVQPTTTLLITLGLLFSGCIGSGGSAGPAGTGTSQEPATPIFTDDTGAIAGTVVSDEQIPIAGASVGLTGPEQRETTTDAQGQFAFSNLAPGAYRVAVSALGYASGSQAVEVQAGQASPVVLTLGSLEIPGLPKKTIMGPLNGKFFCGFGTTVLSGPCKVASLGGSVGDQIEDQWTSVTSGGENNIFDYRTKIASLMKNMTEGDQFTGMVVEVKWKSGQVGSQWLQATIEEPDPEGGRNGTNVNSWNATRGISPLRMSAIPGVKGTGGNAAMPNETAGFVIGVFPSVDPGNPRTPKEIPCPGPVSGQRIPCEADRAIGGSAYTDQKFEVWVTLFFNSEIESNYSVLQDS